jgi:dTDP-glucose 4,6-dehydratase
MNILVTGGLGTVGRGLIATLKERNHSVFSCDLYHSHDEIGYSVKTDIPNPTYSRCDIGEYKQLERLFDKAGPFDLVYNCAAEFGRWNGEDFYENLWKTNAVGLKNILRLQEKLGFKLVHFSSSEVYGDFPTIMKESVMEDYEVKQLNDYAMSKWVNEMQIRNSIQQFGTETVVVRLFNTYGPGEFYSPYRSVNSRFLYCAMNNIPWTVYRGHYRTSTYLNDTVRTLCNIVDNFKTGETYNIGGSYMHSIEELSDVILKVTGADPSLVEYRDSEPLTTTAKQVDVVKAVRDLKHTDSFTLEEGIKLTMDWMKSVYK